MTKQIQLTQGKVALVDDEDFKWINKYKWSASNHGINIPLYYAQRVFNGKTVRMHRLILHAKKGQIIDHINGNGLDNRKSNLRLVTQRQNCQNKHLNKSSKYPGVSWDNARKKWFAKIRINGKRKHLGRYNSEKEAFQAYKKAVHELTGEKLICEEASK